MAKRVLQSLDLVALSVALDRAEDEGLNAIVPKPEEHPEQCAYLKFAGKEQAKLIASRLPHVTVRLDTMGSRTDFVVYHRLALVYVLSFLITPEEVIAFTRSVDTLPRRRWNVVDVERDSNTR